MKYLVALLVTLVSISSISQDSVKFELSGKVVARNTVVAVANPHIRLKINHHQTLFAIGDKNGEYKIEGKIPKGEDVQLFFHIEADQHYPENWDMTINSDKDIEKSQNLAMIPKMECWDSEIPNKIHFDVGRASVHPDLEKHLKELLPNLAESQSHMLDSFVIEITAYCDYNEDESIAEKRADYVYQMLLDAGFNKSSLTRKNRAKKNFYYCQYCEGCHYYFLKGKGVDLKPEFFDKLDKDEVEYYHSLRRLVTLYWVKKSS